MSETLPQFIEITKALSDANRVRILMVLRHGELCVCQIIEMLDLAPSTISKHLSILRHARLVDARKEGRWMHYRRASDSTDRAVQHALKWIDESLRDDERIARDSAMIKAIVRIDPEELCSRQAADGPGVVSLNVPRR